METVYLFELQHSAGAWEMVARLEWAWMSPRLELNEVGVAGGSAANLVIKLPVRELSRLEAAKIRWPELFGRC